VNILTQFAIKGWVPPILDEILRPYFGRAVYYCGDYPNWGAARANSQGYEDRRILQKVRDASRKVKAGQFAFERDSVLFTESCYPFATLATLLRAAVESAGRLAVLDFGGSLGSSYYQCRGFFPTLEVLRWGIVEQPDFVGCGRAEFEDENLKFFDDIASCVESIHPNVAFLSGVLQYIENPFEVFSELSRHNFRYLVIDRTPFGGMYRDHLTVQNVPKKIYRASYPCWVFSRSSFLAKIPERFELIAEFDSRDGWARAGGIRFSYGGMIFRCRD
jgi:putative methyltransferase (TIGR04325 family)